MGEGKNPAYSKTIWAAVLIAAVQIAFPSSKPWIRDHIEELLPLIAAVFVGLRFVTTNRIQITWKKRDGGPSAL
jgi:hypothetical protein